jgi:hypothetical protein
MYSSTCTASTAELVPYHTGTATSYTDCLLATMQHCHTALQTLARALLDFVVHF